jgi:hypothetical protein
VRELNRDCLLVIALGTVRISPPADGDYYSVDEVISKYEYEEDGSLTYWTVSEWV